MEAKRWCLVALILLSLPCAGVAQEGARTADEEAIRATAASFCKAFNAGDANTVAAHWTADGEYVDETGAAYHGRDAIEKEYAALFAAHPGLTIDVKIASIRFVGSDAAVEDGTATVSAADTGPRSTGRYTTIHAKRDGKWLAESVRDGQSVALSTYPHLSALQWLIGDWIAETKTGSLRMSCQWALRKNFIQRTYRVLKGDKVLASGVEMIGWMPSIGCITSSTFDSEGGQTHAVWTPSESGWVIESVGCAADGSGSASVNILTTSGKDRFSWRSTARTIGGLRVPDIDAIEVKRTKAAK